MENIFWIVCQFYDIQQMPIEYKIHSRGWRTGGGIVKVNKEKKKRRILTMKSRRFLPPVGIFQKQTTKMKVKVTWGKDIDICQVMFLI